MSVETLDQFAARLREQGPGGAFARSYRAALIKAALRMQARSFQLATERMRKRTGMLRRSIRGFVRAPESRLPEAVLQAGGETDGTGALRYARLQEEGGTVRPVRRQWLRIPLDAAMTAAGVDRYATSLYDTAPGLFHVRVSRAGNLLLFHNETGKPWYVLKKQTTVPPHWYVRDAGREEQARMPTWLGELVRQALEPRAGV